MRHFRPLWLVPFGIVFEGVSLAWFYLIQKERGRRMGQETGSSSLHGVDLLFETGN